MINARGRFHAAIVEEVPVESRDPAARDSGSPSRTRAAITSGMLVRLKAKSPGVPVARLCSADSFKTVVCKFISETFPRLKHLRPGRWNIQQIGGRERTVIARYERSVVALGEGFHLHYEDALEARSSVG